MKDTSEEKWIIAGLHALSSEGIGAVKVEALARQLGLTKGSFYHHFKNRGALLERMPMGSVIKIHMAYEKPFWRHRGLNGAVVIGHGRSRANAVLPALRAARTEVEAEVNRHIVEDLAAANPGTDEVAPAT